MDFTILWILRTNVINFQVSSNHVFRHLALKEKFCEPCFEYWSFGYWNMVVPCLCPNEHLQLL